jgi:hypothetical protein
LSFCTAGLPSLATGIFANTALAEEEQDRDARSLADDAADGEEDKELEDGVPGEFQAPSIPNDDSNLLLAQPTMATIPTVGPVAATMGHLLLQLLWPLLLQLPWPYCCVHYARKQKVLMKVIVSFSTSFLESKIKDRKADGIQHPGLESKSHLGTCYKIGPLPFWSVGQSCQICMY